MPDHAALQRAVCDMTSQVLKSHPFQVKEFCSEVLQISGRLICCLTCPISFTAAAVFLLKEMKRVHTDKSFLPNLVFSFLIRCTYFKLPLISSTSPTISEIEVFEDNPPSVRYVYV